MRGKLHILVINPILVLIPGLQKNRYTLYVLAWAKRKLILTEGKFFFFLSSLAVFIYIIFGFGSKFTIWFVTQHLMKWRVFLTVEVKAVQNTWYWKVLLLIALVLVGQRKPSSSSGEVAGCDLFPSCSKEQKLPRAISLSPGWKSLLSQWATILCIFLGSQSGIKMAVGNGGTIGRMKLAYRQFFLFLLSCKTHFK